MAPTPEVRYLRVTGGLMVGIASLVILGWVTDTSVLGTFLPGGTVRTVMNTALCALAGGTGFLLLAARKDRAARVAGLFVTGLAALVLLQRLSGRALGIDQFFWHHNHANPGSLPGRMAANTATGFFLVGVGLVALASRRPGNWVIGVGAGLVSALALIPLGLHLSAFASGYTNAAYQGMALPSALCLFAAAVALWSTRRSSPQGGRGSLQLATAGVGVLLSIGLMTVQSHNSLNEANHWVLHTYEVQSDLEHLVAEVARLESGARAYALTGNDSFLARDAYHRAEIKKVLRQLGDLIADNSSQAGHLPQLNELAEQKLERSDGLIGTRQTGDTAAAAQYLLQLSTRETSALVNLVDQMQEEEKRLLTERNEALAAVERNTRAVQIFGSLLAAIFIILALVSARRAAAARDVAETALLASEEQFRSAFDYAGIGMALVGLDGRWLKVNRVLCRVLGYTEAELLAKTFQDITHPADLNADLAHLQDLLAGRTDHYQMEKRYFHSAGHVVHVQLTVSLVRDATRAPVHFVSQVADITQSKQIMASLAAARDEALAASRLKSEFLANMSHEIRTPMNGVIGMADLLLDSPLNADQRQMGGVIRSSAENLLTIINDILDFSKIEAGKLSIEPEDFSLAEQIQHTVALLNPRAQARGLALRTDLPPDLPAGLSGDAGRIQQVLINLVGNAVKFTEQGGVSVVVQPRTPARSGRYAFRLEVRDTGIGIDPEGRQRLFQPFTQADGSTTRKYGGTGLGLAISQQLIGLMDGRIGFDSEVGKGSVFWFELELPVVAVVVVREGARPPAPSVPADPAMRVLVAEDNPANQLVIRMLLEKTGLHHDIVGDGLAAIEQLAARDYAAVLMDCQMPRLDGYEAARRIRAGADGVRQPRIPIIALTAHAQASDREKCLAAGMDDYLSKPIRLEVLLQALQRAGLAVVAEAPAPVAPSARAPVLDTAQLAQLRELPGRENGTLLDELIGMVLKDLPPEFERLQAAVEQRNGVEAAQLAHRLAGSAANIGATGLRQALQVIEYAGRKAEWPAADRGRITLEREWQSVREALQALQPTTPT